MKFKTAFREIAIYYLLSFSITLFTLLNFYNGTGHAENMLSLFYAVTIPTYYFFIFFLVSLIFFPLSFIPYIRYLIILPKILLDFLLIADVIVFRIYRFHIDLMFIDMMVNDYQGIGISYNIVIIALIVFLDYPLNRIELNDTLSIKRNILFFIVESWRSDMMNKESTPNIYDLAQKSYKFKNHYSGGNVTIPGLFSIMYGLHPSYISYAQSDPVKYKTVLTRTLAEYGYDIKVYTSQNFDRFALKAMFFNGIKPENYNCIYKGKNEVIDSILTDKLIDDLKRDESNTPWFKFLFLSSSHYHYNYPPGHKIFTPVPKNSEGFLFNKNIDAQPYLNDYRNSLHYEDALFEKILVNLKQTGEFNNTIIFILSDHGEEFNDNKRGYWGHGSNFTKYQISTPLIVHLPGQEEQVVISKRSSHIDIVPTILKQFLKCKNPVSDFSNGYNLFDLPDKRNFVITSYKDKCYIIDDKVYSTGITINSYDVNDLNTPVKHINYSELNAIKQEELHFIKKKD